MNTTTTFSTETHCVVISEGNEASSLPDLEDQGISLTFVPASDIRRITTLHYDAILIDADLLGPYGFPLLQNTAREIRWGYRFCEWLAAGFR